MPAGVTETTTGGVDRKITISSELKEFLGRMDSKVVRNARLTNFGDRAPVTVTTRET